MWKKLRKNWFWLALGLCGLAGTAWAPHFQPLTVVDVKWNVALALLINGLTLNLAHLRTSLQRPERIGIAVVCGYSFVPLFAYPVAQLLSRSSGDLSIGLLVISAMPTTLASTSILTRLAGGNDTLSLLVTLASNAVGFLAVPAVFAATLGRALPFQSADLMERLLLIVLAPLAAGIVLQQSRRVARSVASMGMFLAVLVRLLILSVVLVGIVKGAIEMGREAHPPRATDLLWLAGAVCLVHSLALVACWSTGVALGWSRRDRIALSLSGSQKTLPAALYVCIAFFPNHPLAAISCVIYHIFQLLIDSSLAEKASSHSTTPTDLGSSAKGRDTHRTITG